MEKNASKVMTETVAARLPQKVVIHNKIVGANFGKLTNTEIDFLYYAFSQIRFNDDDLYNYRVSLRELADRIGTGIKDMKYIVHKLEELAEKKITIYEKDETLIFPWFSIIKISRNKQEVAFRFNDFLKPYLIALKAEFSTAEFVMLINLRQYASRIYLMCKQYLCIGKFSIQVETLCERLSLTQYYKNFKYLKRNVLEPAIDDINRMTDINVSMTSIRAGRKIDEIKFTVWAKPTAPKAPKQITSQASVVESQKRLERIAKESEAREHERRERLFELAEANYLKLPSEQREEIEKKALAQMSIFDAVDFGEDSIFKRSQIIVYYIDNFLGGSEAWYADTHKARTTKPKSSAGRFAR